MASIKKYTTKDGQKRYMFRLYLGIDPQTGKKKQTTRRGFKTQKAAKIEISRLQLQLDDDGELKKANYVKFNTVYDEFIDSIRLVIRQSTLYTIIKNSEKYILPAIGNKRIETISTAEIQSMINKIFRKNGAYKIVAVRLNQMFKFARQHGYINNNPCEFVTIPKNNHKRKVDNFYTRDELEQFLNSKYFNGVEHLCALALFRTLAFTGIRKGEALALRWHDIDFKNSQLRVNKTISYDINHKLTINPPKTASGDRLISMDDITLDILKKWQTFQKQIQLVNGINALKANPIVFSKIGNDYYSPVVPNNWLNTIYQKDPAIKKHITVHGFRHTHASLLFASGVSVKAAQQRLGHSDIKVTLDIYTHLSDDQIKNASEKLSKYANF